MSIKTIQEKTLAVFKQYGVIKASVFGSSARGQDTAKSDVDLLVSVKRPFTLMRFVSLKRGLEKALNKPVDIVEYGAVKPELSESILKDAKIIYEQR